MGKKQCKKCVLCGTKMQDNDSENYPYAQYIVETEYHCAEYCTACCEVLRVKHATSLRKKHQKKVKIQFSDYYLPGYVPTEDGSGYVKIGRKSRSYGTRLKHKKNRF